MAVNTESVALGAARRKGQYRIQTIKSLDGALLVNAEDHGMHGRFEIQSLKMWSTIRTEDGPTWR